MSRPRKTEIGATRITVTLNDGHLDTLKRYCHRHGLMTRQEAVRHLVADEGKKMHRQRAAGM
jgi:metal-responsive CopG/Arc/MetJ family transcriptional regulator